MKVEFIYDNQPNVPINQIYYLPNIPNL